MSDETIIITSYDEDQTNLNAKRQESESGLLRALSLNDKLYPKYKIYFTKWFAVKMF